MRRKLREPQCKGRPANRSVSFQCTLQTIVHVGADTSHRFVCALSCNAPRINWAVQHRWILPPCENLNGNAIAWNEICRSECIARLLFRKGFRSTDEVQNFLRPRLSSLSDPFLLPQMRAAVARILSGLDSHERIVL